MPGSFIFQLQVKTVGPPILTSLGHIVVVQVIDDQALVPRLAPSAVARVAGLRHTVFLAGAVTLGPGSCPFLGLSLRAVRSEFRLSSHRRIRYKVPPPRTRARTGILG